jgi:hypothetical protein
MKDKNALETPDGRYIVVRGRLWRKTNPHLPEKERKRLVSELMLARRAVKDAGEDDDKLRAARIAVDEAKVALGERGPGRSRSRSSHPKRPDIPAPVRLRWRREFRS